MGKFAYNRMKTNENKPKQSHIKKGDIMNKKTIVVLFGGQSSEHEVSLKSATTIIKGLDETKYQILPIGITKKGNWLLYMGSTEQIASGSWEQLATPAILSPDATEQAILKFVGNTVKKIHVDVVIPVLHGANGEDGTVQGLLELANIPYVGCGVLSSAVSMDKVYTKLIAQQLHIPQAKYIWFHKRDFTNMNPVITQISDEIGFPCFIKPANAGSSIGIGKAHNAHELTEALLHASEHDDKIIIEEHVHAREIECAVLGNGSDIQVSTMGEVIAGNEFYDYHAKYENTESKTQIPALSINDSLIQQMQTFAKEIFQGVSGSGLSRIDFFLEHNTNRILFNELNTFPGFTNISMYPMLWEFDGIALSDLLDKLILLAQEKNQGKNQNQEKSESDRKELI